MRIKRVTLKGLWVSGVFGFGLMLGSVLLPIPSGERREPLQLLKLEDINAALCASELEKMVGSLRDCSNRLKWCVLTQDIPRVCTEPVSESPQ